MQHVIQCYKIYCHNFVVTCYNMFGGLPQPQPMTGAKRGEVPCAVGITEVIRGEQHLPRDPSVTSRRTDTKRPLFRCDARGHTSATAWHLFAPVRPTSNYCLGAAARLPINIARSNKGHRTPHFASERRWPDGLPISRFVPRYKTGDSYRTSA